jgi:hypothetical protein
MAANYQVVDPTLGFVAATQTATVKAAPLGYEARFADMQTGTANVGGAKFVYCQGSNVTAAGQFVQIQNNSAVLLASGDSASFYPIGLAAGNISATNVYGWVQVQGIADYALFTNSSFAAGARVALASTAGQIGSVTALGSRIQGIILPNSYTSSQTSMTVQLNYPFVVGITASN